MANFLWETSNKALMISFTCYCEALLEYVLLCWTINCDSIESLTITTTDLDITAGLITVGFVRTNSDVPSLPVMSLKNEKNDWCWAKTDSEGPHHCRFLA